MTPSWTLPKTAPWHAVRRAEGWSPRVDDLVITIDPALRTAGVAVWSLDRDPRSASDRVRLHGAWDVRNDGDHSAMSAAICGTLLEASVVLDASLRNAGMFVLVEKMQHYKGKAARGRALDDVEAVTRALGARFAHLATPWVPAAWKGQIPKQVHHTRLAALLPGAQHGPDAWDAIGLGLFAFGVVGRGGVR